MIHMLLSVNIFILEKELCVSDFLLVSLVISLMIYAFRVDSGVRVQAAVGISHCARFGSCTFNRASSTTSAESVDRPSQFSDIWGSTWIVLQFSWPLTTVFCLGWLCSERRL